MVNPLIGSAQFRFVRDTPTGIWIAVKAREVAAGNFHPDFMAGPENVTGDADVNTNLVDLSLACKDGLVQRIPVSEAQSAVGQIVGNSVRQYVY